MQQKKYIDIERLKPNYCDGFHVGDQITIQEKVDGANFSIRYDSETDTIKAFSRKRELDLSNNLRGAWEWSQKLDKDKIKQVLGDNLILFMEWLVSHSVPYPQERYNNAYCYDIYDTVTNKWLSQSIVKEKVAELNLIYIPVFYEGEFISWEHIKSFVGRTDLGGDFGEGIVVKNMTNLNSDNLKLPFYVKIVCEKFCETKGHKQEKPVDMEVVQEREEAKALVATVVTKARVAKLIHKMVDDGIIPENWDNHDMPTIAKNLGRNVYEDCVKEESEIVNQVGALFGKLANSTAMALAREILEEKENV